jgi:hypothetical protein
METPDVTEIQGPPQAAVGLSIVVPVYRGAATVGALVAALSALRPEGGIEIILVNDGSPDNSGDVCRALLPTATVPLTYIEHARNFGARLGSPALERNALGLLDGARKGYQAKEPEERARIVVRGDKGPLPLASQQEVFGSQFVNRLANRALTDAETRRELPFAGNCLAWSPLP